MYPSTGTTELEQAATWSRAPNGVDSITASNVTAPEPQLATGGNGNQPDGCVSELNYKLYEHIKPWMSGGAASNGVGSTSYLSASGLQQMIADVLGENSFICSGLQVCTCSGCQWQQSKLELRIKHYIYIYISPTQTQ